MSTTIQTQFDFEEAILEGIKNAGGNVEEDLQLIKREDIVALGMRAAYAGQKRRNEFPSFMVVPINDVEEGLAAGHYTDHYSHITKKTVPLKELDKTPKKVYVVPFNETIGQDEYVARLKEFGLKPCVDGPNYLLGLMQQVTEENMPEVLEGKYLVAAEADNPSSVFLREDGYRCFLGVGRDGSGRWLSLADVERGWSDYWAFLAEEA